jgi:hypothetical protein
VIVGDSIAGLSAVCHTWCWAPAAYVARLLSDALQVLEDANVDLIVLARYGRQAAYCAQRCELTGSLLET